MSSSPESDATSAGTPLDAEGSSVDDAIEEEELSEAELELEASTPPPGSTQPELSDNATTVLERRYLKRDASGALVESPAQLFWRVAKHVALAELEFEDSPETAAALARDFYELMATRRFMPNSPTLTNAGDPSGMLSACFVLPVEDSIEGIFESVKATALIQKSGGGTGFSFSRLRPAGDPVGNAGRTGGPLEFMEVFSKASDSIKQGSFRRGANMGILRIDHPDIVDFVTVKDDRSRLTNYNVSVAVTDRFLSELKSDGDTPHQVQNPNSGEWQPIEREGGGHWSVNEIWSAIVDHAWASGEPGIIFIDRINAADPIQNVGKIEATNPCGEQPLHAYDSCNLGSINLERFVVDRPDGATFDWPAFKTTVHTSTRFLDNVIEVNNYPLPQIESMSRATRRIGLGVMGYADALFRMGLPYDSVEALGFAEQVMGVLDEESKMASEILAEERGTFLAWEGSEWESRGRELRNSYTTTVAPTGTISIIAGCSGGIEPVFSLAYTRQVMPDENNKPTVMREVNEIFERTARENSYWSEELIEAALSEGTLANRTEIPDQDRRVFVTARDITPEWHMLTQAAFQKSCDASISKTINFSADATAEEVRTIYDLAIDLGVKGVTVYRDGCRDQQPMALKGGEEAAASEVVSLPPNISADGELQPVKLPEIMSCLRVRQMTPFGNMHVKVSVEPATGREREVFAQLGKGGDIANSDLEAICRILSLWLRSGGSLGRALKQLTGIGSSLSVPTKDGRIMSLADGLAHALHRYLEAKNSHGLEALLLGRAGMDDDAQLHTAATTEAERYKVKCPSCSAELAFAEGCAKCHACGFSQC